MLEIIRESIQRLGRKKEEERVLELSSVRALDDSEIEALEMERIQQAGKDGN
jgi:hypothetical protein